LIEFLNWGVPDVARFFKIPPHRLGDPQRQGWNTTEQENRSYFNTTLGGWTSRIEFEANAKLFRPSEADHYTAFEIGDLVKADTADRYAAHALGIQWGWITRNEVRLKEGLNPLDGLDEPLTPLNMTTGTPPPAGEDEAGAPESSPNEPEPEGNSDTDRTLIFALRDSLEMQTERMAKRLGNSAIRAAKKPDEFLAWINDLEADHESTVRDAFRPVLEAVHASSAKRAGWDLVERFFEGARNHYLQASECSRDELLDRVQKASYYQTADAARLATFYVCGGAE
jgi:hypothetical protein